VLNAPDGVLNVNSLSGTGAVPPQGTYRPSNALDCNWEFHIRQRVVLPSGSVQQPNHQPRFQPNGTYGASNHAEVLGMFLGLRALQLDHRIKSPTAHATTTNAFSAMRMGRFYINSWGVSMSRGDSIGVISVFQQLCPQALRSCDLLLAAFIVSRHETHRPSDLALRVRNWIGNFDVPADGDC
jgi:hypothetical protein